MTPSRRAEGALGDGRDDLSMLDDLADVAAVLVALTAAAVFAAMHWAASRPH
jgi:hypothetical protein